MYDILKLDNFKCFRSQRIPFANLTVLVGANGAGKSSVVQSMLLLRQVIESPKIDMVQLNGPYGLALGLDGSIENQCILTGYTKLSIQSGKHIGALHLKSQTEKASLTTQITHRRIPRRFPVGIFAKEFYYLSAERTGPRMSQSMASTSFVHTGIYGEYTAQILASQYTKIESQRIYPGSEDNSIGKQTNLWLQSLMPNVNVKADQNFQLQVAQVLINNGISEDFLTSTNIGFGISYALPIIVTGLIAKKGCYMIVENPEAHLHPAAQSAMGRFLAMVANAGVKVVIETHSNHIIDGIQIYAAQNKLPLESVVIHNFEIHQGMINVSTIKYNEQYAYSKWPKGFMDQTSKDYLEYYQAVHK